MKLLLDTHTLIWSSDPAEVRRLGAVGRAAIEDRTNEVLVSAASAWEIASKHRSGRLAAGERIIRHWNSIVGELGAVDLSVTSAHGLLAGSFDNEHRDPFDRILAAQAIIEGAHLVTADRSLDGFGAQLLW